MSVDLSGSDLVQVAVPTRDLGRAKAFYGGVLGLPLMFETNGMAFYKVGALRLMVGSNMEADPAPRDGAALYFGAPDLPTLAPALEARGVEFLGPAEMLQRTAAGTLQLRFFRDPDGNLLALMGVVSG